MDEYLDRTFGALADPSRRAILGRLGRGECRVTDLAQPFSVSLNTVSKHIRVLERAGLVRRRVHGREHVIALSSEHLRDAAAWIESCRAFWEPRLDTLEEMLAEERDDGE